MKPYIAIMGFGHNPPTANLEYAAQAVVQLQHQGFGIAVGNLVGTFATALQVADQHGCPSLAVIDPAMRTICHPASTQVIQVTAEKKHSTIADRAAGGLIIGGGPGSLRLIQFFLAGNKPLVCISGTGGIADHDLPAEVSTADTVIGAVERLADRIV